MGGSSSAAGAGGNLHSGQLASLALSPHTVTCMQILRLKPYQAIPCSHAHCCPALIAGWQRSDLPLTLPSAL